MSTDLCLPQLDRIEAKLDRLIKPEGPIVGTEEAMRLFGVRSMPALYRTLKKFQVKAYERGRYRRIDINAAIARKIYTREKA